MTEPAADIEIPAPRPRAEWVDRAKGYGIILVVIGHATPIDRIAQDILIFHMALFFFLSGLTFRPIAGAAGVFAKLRSTLLPYVAFGLLVLAGVVAANAGLDLAIPVPGPLHILLGGNLLVGAFGTFWFPTCLLATLLLLDRVVRLPPVAQGTVLATAFAGALLLGDAVPYNPYGLLTVAMALPFAAAGYHVGLNRLAKPYWMMIAAVLLFAALFFLLAPHSDRVEFKYLRYGDFPISTVAAVSAIIVTCLLSALPIPGIAAIGRASLTIMYMHLLFLAVLQPWMPWLACVALAVICSFALHLLFARSASTRRLFLGMRS